MEEDQQKNSVTILTNWLIVRDDDHVLFVSDEFGRDIPMFPENHNPLFKPRNSSRFLPESIVKHVDYEVEYP